MSSGESTQPFAVKDCALVALATGKKAQNLKEMRDILLTIQPGSIYYHFWGGLLRPRFDDPQYNNDFASWCHYALHDNTLAERLAVIDPSYYQDLELLRQDLIEAIEQRLEEVVRPTWVGSDEQFNFAMSQIVVFDTQIRISDAAEMANTISTLSLGSIYYHIIDARRRPPLGLDDFRLWLEGFGDDYLELRNALAAVDPFFVNLNELRKHWAEIFTSFMGGKLNESA